MKRFLIFSLFFFLVMAGCGRSGGGGGDGAPAQTVPIITNVESYDLDWNSTDSFIIPEYMQFAVYATDPDLDIANLLLTKYWPCNASVPYDGPHIIALSSQFAAEVMYSIIDPMLWNYAPIWFLTGYPLGAWRIEFQIEDAQGNESNIFKIYISVH